MKVNSINYSVYTGKFVPSSCQEQKVLTLTILHKLLQTAYESKLKDAEFFTSYFNYHFRKSGQEVIPFTKYQQIGEIPTLKGNMD